MQAPAMSNTSVTSQANESNTHIGVKVLYGLLAAVLSAYWLSLILR